MTSIIEVHGYRLGNKIEALLDLISDQEVREAVESGASINALDVDELTEELEGLRDMLGEAYGWLSSLLTSIDMAAEDAEAAGLIHPAQMRQWEADLDKIHLRLGQYL